MGHLFSIPYRAYRQALKIALECGARAAESCAGGKRAVVMPLEISSPSFVNSLATKFDFCTTMISYFYFTTPRCDAHAYIAINS